MIKAIKYFQEKDILIPLLISLGWLLALLGTLPFGNFPANDDWAYAKIVKQLLDQQRFFINNWPAMTLLFHILWGALFCKILGFSFFVLRISIMVLGITGIFAGYSLFRNLAGNRFSTILATLLLAFNPFYFSLSATFMTDVSFTSMILLAVLFFRKFLTSDKLVHMAGTIFFCICAVLIRQIGLLLPMAFIPALLLKSKFSLKNSVLSFIPFIFTQAALSLFMFWLGKNQQLPPDFGRSTVIIQNMTHDFTYYVWDRSGLVVFYILAIAFPLSLFGFFRLWRRTSLKLRIITFSIIGVLLVFINNKFYAIPVENVVYNLGIGPKLLKDTYNGVNNYSKLPKDVINLVNMIILLSIVPFFLKLTSNLGNIFQRSSGEKVSPKDLIYLTFVLFILLYSVFLLFNNSLFDRYFLPVYPFILAIVIPSETAAIPRKMKIIALVFFTGMAMASFAGTFDYFSWGRARWDAAGYLMTEKKATPASIDGGFEFNGWYSESVLRRYPATKYSKSWYFVEDDQYRIAFDTMDCYCTEKVFSWFSIQPMRKNSINAMSRRPWHHERAIRCSAESVTPDKKYFYSTDSLTRFGFSGRLSTSWKHSGSGSLMLANVKDYWI